MERETIEAKLPQAEPTIQTTPQFDEDVTIGTDPEFTYVDRFGAVISAHGRGLRGIGHDGAGTPAEIRPGPTASSHRMMSRIKRLLALGNANEPRRDMTWRAAPSLATYPCGGHVHVGVHTTTRGYAKLKWGIPYDYEHVGSILDQVVAPVLSIIEGRCGKFRRRHGGYGGLRDWRSEGRREYSVLEWRMPGTWLSEPKLGHALLAMSRAAMLLELRDPKGIEHTLAQLASFTPAYLTASALRKMMFKPHMLNLLFALERMMTPKEIEVWRYYLNMALNDETLEYSQDIRFAWGVIKQEIVRNEVKTGGAKEKLAKIMEFDFSVAPLRSSDYLGFTVGSQNDRAHKVARLAHTILEELDLPRVPLHIYGREGFSKLTLSPQLMKAALPWMTAIEKFGYPIGTGDRVRVSRLAVGLIDLQEEPELQRMAKVIAYLSARCAFEGIVGDPWDIRTDRDEDPSEDVTVATVCTCERCQRRGGEEVSVASVATASFAEEPVPVRLPF